MNKMVCFLLLVMCSGFAYGADEICVKHVVLPNYPAIALTARVQATMSVEVTISTAGEVLYAIADSGEAGVTFDFPDRVSIRVLPPHVQPDYSSEKKEVTPQIQPGAQQK